MNLLMLSLLIAPVNATQPGSAPQDSSNRIEAAEQSAPVTRARPRATLASYVRRYDWLGIEGEVRFELAISPQGQVTDCRVVRSSGSERLDHRTCQIVQTRARFEPARNSAGEKVADTYQGSLRWYEID